MGGGTGSYGPGRNIDPELEGDQTGTVEVEKSDIEQLDDLITHEFPKPLPREKLTSFMTYLASALDVNYTLSRQDLESGHYDDNGGFNIRTTADKASVMLIPTPADSKIPYGIGGFSFQRKNAHSCPLDYYEQIIFCYPHIDSVEEMGKGEKEGIETIKKVIDDYFHMAD